MGREGYYATGRRKESTAKVWIFPEGSGRITINGRKPTKYFCREDLVIHMIEPLRATDMEGKFDIKVKVIGGGISGQAGAIRHGIARALVKVNPELKPMLKKGGFITRDPRMVERKKYGHPKARKRFQFSKR
ncbi:30S ribosomal protein S9 [bacterium]|nr:30S ribosomal protein S9 [bacterium]RKZ27962.1 MAG: 30S ribosomal protein S9 [bacterium]